MTYHSSTSIDSMCMFKLYVRIQEDAVFALENFTRMKDLSRWLGYQLHKDNVDMSFFVGSHGRFLFTSFTPRALL